MLQAMTEQEEKEDKKRVIKFVKENHVTCHNIISELECLKAESAMEAVDEFIKLLEKELDLDKIDKETITVVYNKWYRESKIIKGG